ncbi:WD repeat-containing protein 4 [Mactra antiquata]
MASLRRIHDILVVLSGDKFIAFSNGQEEEIQIPSAPKEQKDNEQLKSTEAADGKNDSKNCVLASCFSESGKYFAIGDDQKQLHVYKVSPKWELVSSRPVARRCTAIAFPSNQKEVVVADRTGDVYKYSLIDTDSKGELILGHLSMVLDVMVTKDDRYILTCDRDEKIRISYYPNAYNIHAFCLFHTEYVSQVLYINKYDYFISGSGDGRLATWNVNGENLSSYDLVKGQSEGQVLKGEGDSKGQGQEDDTCNGVKKMVYDGELNVLAVIFHRSKLLSLYSLDSQENGRKITECCNDSLTEEPWDICFDEGQRLWVVLPCEQTPVIVYNCSRDETGTICMSETITEKSVLKIRSSLCNNWAFFKASIECQPQFISLQKIRDFDNVKQYLEKKEERISAQKIKNTNNQPPPKKVKTS